MCLKIASYLIYLCLEFGPPKTEGEITVPYPTPTTCGASGAFGGKNAGRGGGAVIAGPLGTAGAATACRHQFLLSALHVPKKSFQSIQQKCMYFLYIYIVMYVYIYRYVILHMYTYIYIRTLKHDMSHMMVDLGKTI